MAQPIGPFFIGPSEILALINLGRHKYDVKHDPDNNAWKNLKIDVLVPVYNEERRIVMCLSSLAKQTIRPNKVLIVDDGSKDRTIQFVKEFSADIGLPIEIVQREVSQGKTPSLVHMANESTADVIFVLDGDTALISDNYLARVLEEINRSPEVAAACGFVKTINKREYHAVYDNNPALINFTQKYPMRKKFKFGEEYISVYRKLLYLFLQKFIYRSQIRGMGTLINPVGCAVAYRRTYLKELFDRHMKDLGYDLTTSEDIFIGFSLNNHGYRNVQVDDVTCITQEPHLRRLFKQFYMWSAAFYQSCYYFMPLVTTPLKCWRLLFKRGKNKDTQKDKEKYKLQTEQDPLKDIGVKYTKKYGRPIGWYIFIGALEKIAFPLIFIFFILAKFWFYLLVTLVAESLIVATVLLITSPRGEKFKNVLLSYYVLPMRYMLLAYDFVVLIKFVIDILLGRSRKWRK